MRNLQQVLSKLVILLMLFNTVLPVASAAKLPSVSTSTACHISHSLNCCEQSHGSAFSVECSDVVSETSANSCCQDHNCSTSHSQFAILQNQIDFSVYPADPVFTEPNGKSHKLTTELLRPPAMI
ncbi:hypothetical protein C9I98_24840 [Photobacterium sanctipauli]|uniref:Uncharacterized protein n=1 Tax=Photobacterium sanctipauli TaxID=1342794 RepID=A0A2T3NAJ4_9GAMM|nr:hypothetical protein [Photobacterium sanctipauli]PSW10751.1 hypothetical protein C9I98_24840 [Photobacterium sanctipauli]